MTSEVAVVGFAQSPCRVREDATTSGVEMLVPIFAEVLGATGLTRSDIGFWCSGSSDYLAGRAFSFVSAVDAIGAVPPTMESHVEMDGAWALYEAWAKRLLHLFQIGRPVLEPAQTRIAVGDDGGQRLIDLMGNRGGHLAHGRQARDARELGPDRDGAGLVGGLALARPGEFGQHGVESDAKSADLVLTVDIGA